MNKTSPDSLQDSSTWEPKYPFDLVVAYEDTPTRNQAMQLYDHLAQNLLDDYDFQCSWWRFDHFRNSTLRDQAADAAAEANMIMVCLRSGERIPELARVWIDTWLPRKDDHKSALVTLVGGVHHEQSASCPANRFLHKVARMSKMDFFCHSFDVERERARFEAKLNPSRTGAPPTDLDKTLQFGPTTPRWGINE